MRKEQHLSAYMCFLKERKYDLKRRKNANDDVVILTVDRKYIVKLKRTHKNWKIK